MVFFIYAFGNSQFKGSKYVFLRYQYYITISIFDWNGFPSYQHTSCKNDACNYADNKEVGMWLNNILKKGSTEDWRKVLKEATGEDISTRAMAEYFKPLMTWLEEQNKGRQVGWD